MTHQQPETTAPFVIVGGKVLINAACIDALRIEGGRDAGADHSELTAIKKRFMEGLTFGPINR